MNMQMTTKEQALLFEALEEEFNKRELNLSEAEKLIIISRFVDGFDFENTTLQHKSVRAWVDMIISELPASKDIEESAKKTMKKYGEALQKLADS